MFLLLTPHHQRSTCSSWAALRAVCAEGSIRINVAKYSQPQTRDEITGAQVARLLLDSQAFERVQSSPLQAALQRLLQLASGYSISFSCSLDIAKATCMAPSESGIGHHAGIKARRRRISSRHPAA